MSRSVRDTAADSMRAPARARFGLVALATAIIDVAAGWAFIARPSATGLVLLIALVLGGWSMVAECIADIGFRRPSRSSNHVDRDESAAVTTVVLVGREPRDVVRTTVSLASARGPVVVVSSMEPDEVVTAMSGVAWEVAPSVASAMPAVLARIETPAVLFMSARSVPAIEECRRAAARLRSDVGWVVGMTEPLNAEGYAPGDRAVLELRRRSAARARGLILWEPDATIVAAEMLRSAPIEPGRPLGAWLRARASEGWCGVEHGAVVSRRAAPTDARPFWDSDLPRVAAATADAAGAVGFGGPRARLLASAALARELDAMPLIAWVVSVLLIARHGAIPIDGDARILGPAIAVLLVARWATVRLHYGVRLRPFQSVMSAALHLPTSVFAIPALFHRRIRSGRTFLPDQPLLWLAVVLVPLTVAPLLDRAPSADAGIDFAIVVSLANVVLRWVIAARALGRRGWDRSVHRVAIDFAARLDGEPGRAVDGSVSGIAIAGPFDAWERGRRVEVEVDIGEGRVVRGSGVVVAKRRYRGSVVVGVQLDLSPRVARTWILALHEPSGEIADQPSDRLARLARRIPEDDRIRRSPRRRIARVAVGGASVLVAMAVTMAVMGFRPLVVRSGSMVPTYAIGDVVIVDWVDVSDLRVGDVVTFPTSSGETTTTHRIRSIGHQGATMQVETRGDANEVSEYWTITDGETLGRAVTRVPKLGLLVTRRGPVLAVVALIVFGMVLLSLAAARRRTEPG